MPIRAALPAILFPALLMFSVAAVAGSTINVPANQPTIQAGIDAASNGDTVLVSAGTYFENINFNGKAITVTTVGGPVATVIDGSNPSSAPTVTFASSETKNAVLSGFTIENQYTVGLSISSASPTIKGNVFTFNSVQNCGGAAISIYLGAPVIQGNLITGNLSASCGYGQAISAGGDSAVQVLGNLISANNGQGVSLYQATASINVSQNTIAQNRGSALFIYGGSGPVTAVQNLITGNQGTALFFYSGPLTAVNNTFANNNPACCGGTGSEITIGSADSTVVLQNNLIVGTSSSSAVYCGAVNGSPSLQNNDVFSVNSAAYGGVCQDPTGTNGNISADPLFVDLLSQNFHIQSTSAAVKAGTIAALFKPRTDFDGDPRVIANTIDIGADEYTQTAPLTLSSLSLHYGSQDVGTTSASQAAILTNTTKKAIALNLIATGANFAETNNCGSSLAAGANCQINVTFSPLLGGIIESALGIFTGATANPLGVNLIGTGLAPQVQTPYSFYFYGQVVHTKATQTGQVINNGQAPLTISSIVYSGPTDFVATNNCPIAPKTLAVGASCTITADFKPSFVGNESGTITLTDNALPKQQVVYLSGSSVSAGIPTFNPTSLTFPTTLIGQTSSPQNATLTNTGIGPLVINSIYSSGDFPQTNNCPAILSAHAHCTFTLTFTPTYNGNENGSIYVYTDSSVYQVQLSASGNGQAPVPTLSSLSVSSLPAGSTSAQITLTGTGFVPGSTQILWNGLALPCCDYVNGGTQITNNLPTSYLATPGTYQISVVTAAPGGGTSNSLPFVVYQPVNYAVSSATYNYRAITGTNLNLSNYYGAPITSPFPIQMGGGSFTNLTVSPSGTISFNGFFSPYNDVIPTTQAPILVAPFWASLYSFGSANDNNVFWAVTGTAPNRQLVVEWRNVGVCCETSNTIRFEVVFFEGNSNIEFNYANTVFGGSYSNYDNGAAATAGVQVAPALGTQFSYNQPLIKSKTSLLWYPSSPTATVSTSSLSFGYRLIGAKSQPQRVTLTNGSQVPLLISSVAINNGDFQQTNNCGTSLPAHKSCSFQITFGPSQPLAETATLTINDNATNSPQTVSLSGIGSVTPILIYPLMANFGTVTVGQTGSVPVVLANGANTPLTIQQISTAPGVYTETNNCGTSLAAGASCTVAVIFAPVQPGNVAGKLSMALNGKPLVAEVKLTGSG